MNLFIKIIVLLLITVLLGSCKTLKEVSGTFKDLEKNVTEDIHSLVEEVKPIEDFTKRAVIGIFDGAADPKAQADLDTLTRRMNDLIKNYLNKTLDSLNTAQLGGKFVQGAKDSLLNDDTEKKLKNLISAAADRAGFKLDSLIRATFSNLSSPKNQAALNKAIDGILSDTNASKLSVFISKGLKGIDFKPVGDSILTGIFSEQFSARLDSLTASAVRSAEDATAPVQSWIKRQITWLIILIVLAAFIIILLRYIYKRKNLKNINSAMMAEIQAIGDDGLYQELTARIKQRAISMNVESDLNRELKEHGLIDNRPSTTPKRKW